MIRLLARWRVALGFVFGAVALWLAAPTWRTLELGAGIAALGEAIRLWAAGHVEKSLEVTQSGPYGFTRHPLYLGSSIIGIGIAIACNQGIVAALVILYLATAIPAAIRAEEAHLREKFGDAYDDYAQRRSTPMPRRWSVSRALSNREHHTVIGVLTGLALLALKVQLSIR